MVASIEDYSAAIVVPKMVKAQALQGGHPVEKNGRLLRYAGGFCVVYPFEVRGKKYAVRCWHTPVQSVQDNLGTILSMVRRSELPYFVPCSYVQNATMTARCRQKYRSPKSDYFSELVIYTSIRTLASHPGLWRKYNLANTETMLFTEADISSGGTTEIFRLIESDRDIRHLGRAIKDALRQPGLDRIVPLEEIENGQETTIIENISQRWASNGFQFSPFQSNVEIFNQLKDIASRW